MLRLARWSVAAGTLAFLFACTGDSVAPPIGGPSFAVSDGAHNGNPDFFFLPPLFKNPSSDPNFEPGAFNPFLHPAVEICELGDPLPPPAPANTRECVRLIKRFEPGTVNVSTADQQYQVNWNTTESGLNVAKFYRIRVLVGSTQLGFADVDPVSSGNGLKNVQTAQYIGLVDGRTLPIKFRIESGALCAVDGTPCAGKTINLAQGGGVELVVPGEDFHFDIAPGTQATSGGQAVTDVTFNLEVCDGIDVDLPKFGQCLRVTALFDAPGAALQLSKPALVSMCSFAVAEGDQEKLITLHQQDGDLIRALPHAHPNCDVIGARVTEAPGLVTRGWHWVRDLAARLFTPAPLYAGTRTVLLHLGGGGETNLLGATCTPSPVAGMALGTCVPAAAMATPFPTGGHTISDFQFALPAKMDYLNPDDASRSAAPGTSLPTAVKVTDWNDAPVQGARVTFTQTAIEGPGTVIGTAVSNSDGVAQVSWTIAAGANTLVASGRGIAARNNYPEGPVKPFMPDIFSTAPQTAVIVRDGAVIFTATGRLPTGALAFVQQPTDQIANLRTLLVVVRAQDEAGAVLPAVLVTLKDGPRNSALGCGMGGTELTALTDATGRATFSLIDVSGACEGATLVATGSKVGFAAMSVESQSFAIADIGGRGTPTIDGQFDESWAAARCLQFSAAVPEGGSIPAMLCAMNDEANVYFLVRFSRAPDPQSSVDFQFDQNRSGGINSGDDLIIFRNPQFTFEDDHWFDSSVSPTCPVDSLCSRSDVSAGGTSDGQGAFGNNGGETVIEVSHPLHSGDNHDISVATGQTLDFFLGLNIFASATSEGPARTFFPSGRLLKLLIK